MCICSCIAFATTTKGAQTKFREFIGDFRSGSTSFLSSSPFSLSHGVPVLHMSISTLCPTHSSGKHALMELHTLQHHSPRRRGLISLLLIRVEVWTRFTDNPRNANRSSTSHIRRHRVVQASFIHSYVDEQQEKVGHRPRLLITNCVSSLTHSPSLLRKSILKYTIYKRYTGTLLGT